MFNKFSNQCKNTYLTLFKIKYKENFINVKLIVDQRILKLVSCKRKKKKKWEMRVIMFSCDLRLKRNVLTCVFYGNVTKWAVSELKLSRIEGPARAMIDRDDRSFLESTLAYTHHAIVSNL